MASYRDPQCPETVFDLFDKAACPSRISVGVYQHNEDSDEDVLAGYRRPVARHGGLDFSDWVRVYSVPADRAQGPVLARYSIEQRPYHGERYYLIIDSHPLFSPHWDDACIRMWNQACQLAPRSILTMYPADFNFKLFHRRWPARDYEHRPPGYLHFSGFDPDSGLVSIMGADMAHRSGRPIRSLFWSASYSFGSGSRICEVPFNPHCTYVFIGEEISMAAQLWTHGYDFFHPTHMVVYQMGERPRPLFWEHLAGTSRRHRQRREQEQAVYRRLRTLLGLHSGQVEAPYGLGTIRTLAEYEGFIGIDMWCRMVTPLGFDEYN